MRRLVFLLTLVMAVAAICPAWGKTLYMTDEELQAEARQGFEQILDLWRGEKYGAVYERTTGKETKERFVDRLASAPLKPACCWEKMQEVRVTVKGEGTVLLRAKVGLEGGVETAYKTRSFKLVKEDGEWKISQADILALSGAVKKKTAYKRKKRHYSSAL